MLVLLLYSEVDLVLLSRERWSSMCSIKPILCCCRVKLSSEVDLSPIMDKSRLVDVRRVKAILWILLELFDKKAM